jgi:hypothetical protein
LNQTNSITFKIGVEKGLIGGNEELPAKRCVTIRRGFKIGCITALYSGNRSCPEFIEMDCVTGARCLGS